MDKPIHFEMKFDLRIFRSVNSEFESQLLGIAYFRHTRHTSIHVHCTYIQARLKTNIKHKIQLLTKFTAYFLRWRHKFVIYLIQTKTNKRIGVIIWEMDGVGARWMIYKLPVFRQRAQTYIEKKCFFTWI